jgi:hypothetical protein
MLKHSIWFVLLSYYKYCSNIFFYYLKEVERLVSFLTSSARDFKLSSTSNSFLANYKDLIMSSVLEPSSERWLFRGVIEFYLDYKGVPIGVVLRLDAFSATLLRRLKVIIGDIPLKS